jgi:CRISPR-associated endonuclease/helicase Cas3
MSTANFPSVFTKATGLTTPFAYQCRLACGPEGLPTDGAICQSQLINIPTGLGKTAAVVLAWLWNRLLQPDIEGRAKWPRRLVYCLPMRTLVEQTRDNIQQWLAGLGLSQTVGLHVLMGGEDGGDWDIYPEKDAILIGTQDMLLSRALNRGYGMSRYRWPMHFGLLNNDCLWVMDETQLMGPGLWTSGQLDWMRNHRFSVMKPCVTWWMSATNSPVFLDTPDRRKQQLATPPVIDAGEDPAALSRLNPTRPLTFWRGSVATNRARKNGPPVSQFGDMLAGQVRAEHIPGTLSLVICNSVKTAQRLYELIGPENAVLLTSRFRRSDRDEHTKRLLAFEEQRKEHNGGSGDDTLPNSLGLICVSTQVVEAGVDLSARRLWLEAAPWPSVIQRLGRLNRDGRADGNAKAVVFQWTEEGKKGKGQRIGPYEAKDIEDSLKLLRELEDIYKSEPTLRAKVAMEKLRGSAAAAMDAALKPKAEPFPRAMDVHGLFSTEPDLFGGFTDVSPWVRGDDQNADVTVFWREFDAKKGPKKTDDFAGPAFDAAEGCSVAIHRFRDFIGDKGRALVWDERSETWQSIWASEICPGMVVMLPRTAGGYSKSLGWTGTPSDQLEAVDPPGPFSDTFDDDPASEQAEWVTLGTHLVDTKAAANRITTALYLDGPIQSAVITAAEWHDIGKAHPVWQNALPRAGERLKQIWAKAPFVFVLEGKNSAAFRESTQRLIESAGIKANFLGEESGKGALPRQLWTVTAKIRNTQSRPLLSEIEDQAKGQLKSWMRRFQPRSGRTYIRHEAASALAAWSHYFTGSPAWPGLTLFLIACHHGKVRTALYARGEDGEDICGVPREPSTLPWLNGMAMDFSCAAVGINGEFSEDGLTFTPGSPGWSSLVTDLLGGWEPRPQETPPPNALRAATEPRLLGPFSLAYLESLICAADIQASQHPSQSRHV